MFNCCSTTLVPSLYRQNCCSGTTGRAKVAEWRQNHCHVGPGVAMVAELRHSERVMDTIGRSKEAKWWYKGGRSIAQIEHIVYNRTHFHGATNDWPLYIHSRPRRCVCLLPASFERPVSDRPPRRPLCEYFENAQIFTAIMASMATSQRTLCHPWTTKATLRPPLCLQWRSGQVCDRTRESQRSQTQCKRGY